VAFFCFLKRWGGNARAGRCGSARSCFWFCEYEGAVGGVSESSVGNSDPRWTSVSAILPLLSAPTGYDSLVLVGMVEPKGDSVVIPETFWKRWGWKVRVLGARGGTFVWGGGGGPGRRAGRWAGRGCFDFTRSPFKVSVRLRFRSDSGQVPGLSRTMALLHTEGTHADTVFTFVGTLSASVSSTFWLRLSSRGLRPCRLTQWLPGNGEER
jgi:hypothetical protein